MMQRPSVKGVPELEIGPVAAGAPETFGAKRGVEGSSGSAGNCSCRVSAKGGGFGTCRAALDTVGPGGIPGGGPRGGTFGAGAQSVRSRSPSGSAAGGSSSIVSITAVMCRHTAP